MHGHKFKDERVYYRGEPKVGSCVGPGEQTTTGPSGGLYAGAKVVNERSCGQGDHPGSSRSKSERYKDFRLQYRSARRISVTESEDLGLSMWKQCVGMPRLPNKFQSRASIPRLDLCSFCSPDSQPNNCLHRLHSNSPDRLGKVSSFIFSFSFNSSSVSCSPPLEETQDLEFATCAGIALTILKPRSSNFFCGCRD